MVKPLPIRSEDGKTLAGSVSMGGKVDVPTASPLAGMAKDSKPVEANTEESIYLRLRNKMQAHMPTIVDDNNQYMSALSEEEVNRRATANLIRSFAVAEDLVGYSPADWNNAILRYESNLQEIAADKSMQPGGRNDTEWNRNVNESFKKDSDKAKALMAVFGDNGEKYFDALVYLALDYKAKDVEREVVTYKQRYPEPAEGSPASKRYTFMIQPLLDKQAIVATEVELGWSFSTTEISSEYIAKVAQLTDEETLRMIAYPQQFNYRPRIEYAPPRLVSHTTPANVSDRFTISIPTN